MPVDFIFAAGNISVDDVSTLNPASPPAESIKLLFLIVCAASAFILAVVWGVLFYSLVRFRRKREVGASHESEPPQVYGSMPIEIAWTVAPGLIVVLLTLVIVRSEYEVRRHEGRQPEGAQPVNVTVIGHQWWWEYRIQDESGQQVVTANELHVPVSAEGESRPIYLSLHSADVCHSFWVPRLGGKTDLIPGRATWMWFETDSPGLYVGQCAEYCGTQHANMLLHVYVDTLEDYAKWLENEQKPAAEDAAVEDGRKAFFKESCVNCHTIRGTTAEGKFGPDLTHFAARKTFAGGMITLNRENVRRWVEDPESIKPGCRMPDFGLSSRSVNLITDYLMSLK